jgi:hypothetical protein
MPRRTGLLPQLVSGLTPPQRCEVNPVRALPSSRDQEGNKRSERRESARLQNRLSEASGNLPWMCTGLKEPTGAGLLW